MMDRSKLETRLKEWKPRYLARELDDVNPAVVTDPGRRVNVHDDDKLIVDTTQGYYGNIGFVDAMFGEVLRALDEMGLREDTLVLFTADHGEMLFDHRLWQKMTFFDVSVHVPLIVSWPRVLPQGKVTDALVEQVDIFHTLMDLLGLPTPSSVQGKSLASLLLGRTDKHRAVVYSECANNMTMQFDGRFKCIDNGPDVAPELYDLRNDPWEITNIAGESAHKDTVAAKIPEMRKWKKIDAADVIPPTPRKKRRKGGKEIAGSVEIMT